MKLFQDKQGTHKSVYLFAMGKAHASYCWHKVEKKNNKVRFTRKESKQRYIPKCTSLLLIRTNTHRMAKCQQINFVQNYAMKRIKKKILYLKPIYFRSFTVVYVYCVYMSSPMFSFFHV